MSRKSRANREAAAILNDEAPLAFGTTPQPEAPVAPQPEAYVDEITANCPAIVRAERPKAGSGRSVIAAMYKKLHALDAIAEAVSLTVRGDDASAKVDADLFDRLCALNGIDPVRWAHLNIGMQVMALTNTLRNRAKKGGPVWLTLADADEDESQAA